MDSIEEAEKSGTPTAKQISPSPTPAKSKHACRPCRTRKIKCDGTRPECGTCVAHQRNCCFDREGRRRRSRVFGSRRDAQDRRRRQRNGEDDVLPPRETNAKDSSVVTVARRDEREVSYEAAEEHSVSSAMIRSQLNLEEASVSHNNHVSLGEQLAYDDLSGVIEARGPTNTLYESPDHHRGPQSRACATNVGGIPEAYARATLTYNATLERQREALHKQGIIDQGNIAGVPAELALHLLDIHWSRHHFFLVTYRPAFYRDMATNGPYYSELLLFAILAVSSRYSERAEVGGGDHSLQSGYDFYVRARELLVEDMEKSSIPTATALILMGNALVSAGQIDRGWLYTGMGIRMIINLGLHIDAGTRASMGSPGLTWEDVEIRRRLFWGAFVSEKLQSLYLGRPFFIHESDIHVPKRFLDVYEEEEIWRPVPEHVCDSQLPVMASNSITSFTNQCILAEICGDIMSSFYAVKAKRQPPSRLYAARDSIRRKLSKWLADLPSSVQFTPWDPSSSPQVVPIHIIVLHTVYYSLQILLERPFVADGHLSSKDQQDIGSWGECTVAAEKIAHLLYSYRHSYTFRRIPYQLCYTTYVASTILVRNANNNTNDISACVKHLAVCLKAFEEMKLAHPGSSRMEARIRTLMTRLGVDAEDRSIDNLNGVSPSSSRLPNQDFNTSNVDAIQNRNIDIDAIRQTFAQQSTNPRRDESEPSASDGALERLHLPMDTFHFSAETPSGGHHLMNMGYGNAPIIGPDDYNLEWNMMQPNFGDDLLFGVLGSNWS